MRKIVALSVPLLAACTTAASDTDPPPPPPLALDQDQPMLALFEHVIGDYFAFAGEAPPTTCAILRTGKDGETGLSAEQEEALLKRFSRLAPAGRCEWDGEKYADSFTGDKATVIDIYQFACKDGASCSGWVNVRGPSACRPAVQYRMSYSAGSWQFERDERLLAQ